MTDSRKDQTVLVIGRGGGIALAAPERRDSASLADFADPDGHTWVIQEIRYRPGSGAPSRASPPSAKHGCACSRPIAADAQAVSRASQSPTTALFNPETKDTHPTERNVP